MAAQMVFPEVNEFLKHPDDLIALGGDFLPETLKEAYSKGLFPWPHQELSAIPWFSPLKRCIFESKDLHLSHSLLKSHRKWIQSGLWKITIDQSFEKTIRACALTPRKDAHQGTWITEELIQGYCALHEQGLAHSVEIWDSENYLIGGIYGVELVHLQTHQTLAFSAESMFHLRTDASKLALVALMDWVQKTKKLNWIDAQVINPHLKSLGAKEISRKKFYSLLFHTYE